MGFATTADMDIGNGTTIAFSVSAFELRATSINGVDMSRTSHNSTHFGSTKMTKIFSSLRSDGNLDVEGAFDPALLGALQASLASVAETITVTYPDGTTAIGTGAMTNGSYSVPNEDVMTCSFTWEWDGVTGPTYT